MNVLTVVALNQKCVTMNGLHLYCFVMLKLNHFQNKTKAIYFYTHFQKKQKTKCYIWGVKCLFSEVWDINKKMSCENGKTEKFQPTNVLQCWQKSGEIQLYLFIYSKTWFLKDVSPNPTARLNHHWGWANLTKIYECDHTNEYELASKSKSYTFLWDCVGSLETKNKSPIFIWV